MGSRALKTVGGNLPVIVINQTIPIIPSTNRFPELIQYG